MFSLPFTSKAAKEPPTASPAAASVPAPTSVPTLADPIESHPESTTTRSPVLSARSIKQLGLFFAGAGFLTFSTLVTRRAIARKQIASLPKFYQPSHRPPINGGDRTEGSLVALEALNLATLNVISFGIMAAGGLSWAFDISSVEDLRSRARRHVGYQPGEIDEKAEKEIEEWVTRVLLKKEKPGEGEGEGGGKKED